MKKITSVLALVTVLALCISLMAACTGGDKNPTDGSQKPGTTTGTSKDDTTKPEENKPQQTQPEQTQPEEDQTPEKDTEDSTQPAGGEGETEGDITESQPSEEESAGK